MNKHEAFRALTDKYLHSLYNYARVLARGGPEAEDLLQETLLGAFRRVDTLRAGTSPKPWLFAIMRNAHIDQYRRQGCTPPVESEADGPAGDLGAPTGPDQAPLDPESILLRRIALEDVREAMRRLPPHCREVVELRELEGLSYQEIGHVIGRPVGTVMSRLYRGRNMLRAMLQQPERLPHEERERDL